MNADGGYIHVVNWDEYQHGKTRDNPWVKDYLAQLHKDEYLELSFHLRGVLQGIRLAYAASHRQLRDNTATLTRQLGHRVMRRDIVSLCDAGLIEVRASSALAQSKRRVEKDTTTSYPKPVSGEVQEIYDHWRTARGKTDPRYSRVSDQRRAKIKARLAEFTAAELLTAIDNVARDPWPERPRHDDITILFRNREQVDKFLDLPAGANGHGLKLTGWRLAHGSHGSTLVRDPAGTDQPPRG